MNVAIVDYGVGNINTIQHCLNKFGIIHEYTSDHNKILKSDKVIFPGVGDATYAMNKLKSKGLDKLIVDIKQPLLGICLGMQLLCNYTQEGNTDCLGIIDLDVLKFDSEKEKVPQIGWNNIYDLDSRIFNEINENDFIYMVHSYYVPLSNFTIATTKYGIEYSSAIKKDNFYGTQFLPEKSGLTGETIIKNFLEL